MAVGTCCRDGGHPWSWQRAVEMDLPPRCERDRVEAVGIAEIRPTWRSRPLRPQQIPIVPAVGHRDGRPPTSTGSPRLRCTRTRTSGEISKSPVPRWFWPPINRVRLAVRELTWSQRPAS